jgi:CRISPR-associated protein Cas2
MNLLVSYDVNTLTKEGRRRLRRLAKACTSFGQRVQFSVFEVTVNDTQKERFVARLIDIIDTDEDSLRIYHLPANRDAAIEVHGRDAYVDFTGTLAI